MDSVTAAAGVACEAGFGEVTGGGARVGFPALRLPAVEAAAAAVDEEFDGFVVGSASLRVAAALYSSRRSCSCWMRCCCTVRLVASDIFNWTFFLCDAVCFSSIQKEGSCVCLL